MTWFTFHHEAMATDFSVTVAGHPAEYARQAAAAGWRELDRLESELSRYVESSDLARANHLACGETLAIGDDALQCLLLAAEVAIATGRAFDAAYASEHAGDAPPFTIDPDAHTLTSHATRLHLDLGAIGKGYALDRIAAVLREWDVTQACLQSGGSTALALDAPADHPGWPVGIGDEAAPHTIDLVNAALSGSGIAVKGEHLVNPRTGRPAGRTSRAWALAPDAAISDALSTAFYIMSDDDVARFCAEHPEIGAALATLDHQLVPFGALQPLLFSSSRLKPRQTT